MNKYFKMYDICKNVWFEFFMYGVVLGNTICLMLYALENDQNVIDVLDEIDEVLVFVYFAEVIIKIIGLGFHKFFEDNWNKYKALIFFILKYDNRLDFILTMISLVTNVAAALGRFARTAVAGKILKLNKVSIFLY